METFADLLDEQLPPQALQAWLEELTALPANQVSAAAVAEVPVSA
jgi:hypothetical protein